MYRENELPPPRTLHDPQAVGIATFLGSPLAGAVLMALNERAVGRSREAWKIFGLGLAATSALMTVSMLLPPSVPSGAFGGVNVAIAMGAPVCHRVVSQGNRVRVSGNEGRGVLAIGWSPPRGRAIG